MSRLALQAIFGTVLAICGSGAYAGNLLVEWSDQPSNPDWMPGRPVFLRTLNCVQVGKEDSCTLTVVTVSRLMCPTIVTADRFDTGSGNLKVVRTATEVTLEFTDISNRWNIHLALVGNPTIVDTAAGVVVTAAQPPQGKIRSSNLEALANDKQMPSRGFVDVDLNCSKISAVAAKRRAEK